MMEKVMVLLVAAAKLALPGWLAVRVQLPAVNSFKLPALTLQTAGVKELIVTGKPELADAVSVGAAAPSVCVAGGVKLIVCVVSAVGVAAAVPLLLLLLRPLAR
jgi:hypothetical protein